MLERLKKKFESLFLKSKKEEKRQELVKNYKCRTAQEYGIRTQIYNIFRADPNITDVQTPDTMSCVTTEDGGGYRILFIYDLSTPGSRDEPKQYLFTLCIKFDYNLEELCVAIRDSRLKVEDPERKKSEERGYVGYWGYIFWKRKLLEDENGRKKHD